MNAILFRSFSIAVLSSNFIDQHRIKRRKYSSTRIGAALFLDKLDLLFGAVRFSFWKG